MNIGRIVRARTRYLQNANLERKKLEEITVDDAYKPIIEFAMKGSKMALEKDGDPLEVAKVK